MRPTLSRAAERPLSGRHSAAPSTRARSRPHDLALPLPIGEASLRFRIVPLFLLHFLFVTPLHAGAGSAATRPVSFAGITARTNRRRVPHRGAGYFASLRCRERRCSPSRRAACEIFPSQSVRTRWMCSHSTRASDGTSVSHECS